tara:strand:+ start:151 stop:837 length:687 start_codon:yes stop_codon:yes gene_type:complete
MAGEMKHNFYTNSPKHITDFGDNIIYPFGPPIFQSELDQNFINALIDEGNKLTVKNDDWRARLAGQMKYGGSYKYKEEFKLKAEKYLLEYVKRFCDGIIKNYGEKMINKLFSVKGKKGTLKLDTLWINYQQKHDYNPPHSHNGVLSFVIYCKVPKLIFTNNAVSNTQDSGKVVFMHGEESHALVGTNYPIEPFEGLFLLFPNNLIHHVPPFWVDEERISVSGNFEVVS